MIIVHHLNDSRSQRILWLLEELALPYRIKAYARDPKTNLAPPALLEVHPLGKSPIVEMDGQILIESGAIVEAIVRAHGGATLAPPADPAEHNRWLEWLHYAEGSAMLPLMLQLYVARLGEAGAPLHPRIASELANHLGYVEGVLSDREWLLESGFSAADIQMSFVGEAARAFGIGGYPAIMAWVERCHQRPAWQRALEAGGPYRFA